MSTRVTSSIAPRRAREKLIRLLFPSSSDTCIVENNRQSYDRCQTQNDAISADACRRRHSYSQLRAAYIQQVHALHPDKIAHRRMRIENEGQLNAEENANNNDKEAHLKFIELKSAWEEYDASMRVFGQDKDGANNKLNSTEYHGCDLENYFTMFGVGCSFADSPEERDLRNEIMEQACKGWFPSGSLACSEQKQAVESKELSLHNENGGGHTGNSFSLHLIDRIRHTAKPETQYRVKLSDDAMFVARDFVCNQDVDGNSQSKKGAPSKKCLVQNIRKLRFRKD